MMVDHLSDAELIAELEATYRKALDPPENPDLIGGPGSIALYLAHQLNRRGIDPKPIMQRIEDEKGSNQPA
jgi:hypothetical protein